MAQIEALGSQGMDDAIICDLFVNSRFRVSDVAYLANTTGESVIQTLLRRGIVKDRRSKPRPMDNGNCLRILLLAPDPILTGCPLPSHASAGAPKVRSSTPREFRRVELSSGAVSICSIDTLFPDLLA